VTDRDGDDVGVGDRRAKRFAAEDLAAQTVAREANVFGQVRGI